MKNKFYHFNNLKSMKYGTYSQRYKKNRFFSNLYTKKPIFKRKLIEKYSTTRYNFNTKFVYTVANKSKTRCFDNSILNIHAKKIFNKSDSDTFLTRNYNLDTHSVNYKLIDAEQKVAANKYSFISVNSSNPILKRYLKNNKGSGKYKLKIPDYNSKSVDICNNSSIYKDEYNDSNTEYENSKVLLKNNSIDKINNLICNLSILQNKKQVQINLKEPILSKKIKLLSNNIYNFFLIKYNIKELSSINDNLSKAELECLSKLRKGNHSSNFDNCESFDYTSKNINCLYDSNIDINVNYNEDSQYYNEDLRMVIYVGINRPLFPLIYKNLATVYKRNDNYITSNWANFSLSTLITKKTDTFVKKFIIPVKDPKLLTVISYYDQIFGSPWINVLLSKFQVNVMPKCSNDFQLESLDKKEYSTVNNKNYNNNLNCKSEKSKTENRKLSHFHNFKECFVKIPRLNLSLGDTVYLKSENKEVKSNIQLEKFSNQSENKNIQMSNIQLSNNDLSLTLEKENNFWIENYCSRTSGIIMDYVTRNHSLVYFYKINKILNFQKQNNKHFKSCSYICFKKECDNISDDDYFVDIISYEDNQGYNYKNVDQTVTYNNSCEYNRSEIPEISKIIRYNPKLFTFTNFNCIDDYSKCKLSDLSNILYSDDPNKIFNSAKIILLKKLSVDNPDLFNTVDDQFLKFTKNLRWCMITFNKSLIQITYAHKTVLPFNILFELLFRAELSKTIVTHNLNSQYNINLKPRLKFGVYAFPGICNTVLFGPYTLNETSKLSCTIKRSEEEILEIPFEMYLDCTSNKLKTLKEDIYISWWSPLYDNSSKLNINEHYLNSFFAPNKSFKNNSKEENLQIKKLLEIHKSNNFVEYKSINCTETNFVLMHAISDFNYPNKLIENQNLKQVSYLRTNSAVTLDENSSFGIQETDLSMTYYEEYITNQIKYLCSFIFPNENQPLNIPLKIIIDKAVQLIHFLRLQTELLKTEKAKLILVKKMLLIKLKSKHMSLDFLLEKENNSVSLYRSNGYQQRIIDNNALEKYNSVSNFVPGIYKTQSIYVTYNDKNQFYKNFKLIQKRKSIRFNPLIRRNIESSAYISMKLDISKLCSLLPMKILSINEVKFGNYALNSSKYFCFQDNQNSKNEKSSNSNKVLSIKSFASAEEFNKTFQSRIYELLNIS